MTNPKEIAAALHGMEYRTPIPKNIRDAAKEAGIVIVYGASDDLMEFDGAIRDETDVPHEIFDIMEDGEVYCRGIVFRLGDIA